MAPFNATPGHLVARYYPDYRLDKVKTSWEVAWKKIAVVVKRIHSNIRFDMIVCTKGQLISKCLFGVSNSPKKLENSNFSPTGAEIFRSFLGKIEKPKM